jgi:hypothetical protein
MNQHGSDIARHQHPAGIGRDAEYFAIGSTIRNDTRRLPKVEGGLAATHTATDVGVKVGVSLEGNLQTG